MASRKMGKSLDDLLLEQNDLQISDIVSTLLPLGKNKGYEKSRISREGQRYLLEPKTDRQSSGVVSALLSPRLAKVGSKYRLSSKGNQYSETKNPPMLLKFAESVEEQLISSFGNLYSSGETTISSQKTMMLQENMKEFKQTLHEIRSSNPKMALGHDSPDHKLTTSINCERPMAEGIAFVEEKMKPWIELTQIDSEPDLHPKRALHATTQQQRICIPKQHKTCTPKHLRLTSALSQLSDTSKGILVTPSTVRSIHIPDLEYVRFTFQFLIMTERLKVVVRNARNLFKNTDNLNEANSFAEACLLPGKVQLQTSEIVRKSKNPEFKSLFYFRGFTLADTHLMNLRIRLLGKKNILSRPKIIGEVVVSLENFDLVSENQLEEQLYTRIVPHSSGSIRHVLV